MIHRTRTIAVIIVVFVFIALLSSEQTSLAQSNCGNGLTQQLSIGVTGWVIPEPPQPVNIRDTAGGDLIGQIQPSETFIVLDGPTCDSTYSWWQVESENGVIGWIAEGVSDYFVESLPMGGGSEENVDNNEDNTTIQYNDNLSVTIEDTLCEASPAFDVGESVQINNYNADAYYGHPLLDEALFSVTAMYQYYEREASVIPLPQSPDWMATFVEGAFIVDGPYCVNNEYLYKVGGLASGEVVRGPFYGIVSTRPFWFFESDLAFGSPIDVNSALEISVYDLVQQSAPIIDSASQLLFSMGGGGNEEGNYWTPVGCSLGDLHMGFGYARTYSNSVRENPACMIIYPLSQGELTIRIYDPEGNLYTEDQSSTQTIEIQSDFANENGLISASGVLLDVPDEYGLMTGIWTIEIQASSGEISRRAYHLFEDRIPRIRTFCDSVYPRTLINEMGSDTPLDIVYVSVLGIDETSFIDAGESERWSVVTNFTGDLLLDWKYLPSHLGYFVMTGRGAEWFTSIPTIYGGTLEGFTSENSTFILTDCSSEYTNDPMPLEFDRIVTSTGNFTFLGLENSQISLQVAAFSPVLEEEPSLNLQLQAPDDTVLLSETNVDRLMLDTLILPQDGSYNISITSNIGFPAFRVLQLPEEDSLLPTTLEYNTPTVASLESKTQWSFDGILEDIVTISVDSPSFDPILTLRDEDGNELARDDDSGDGLNARIEYTIPADGIYIIDVTAWNNKQGEYTIEVTYEN